MAKNSEVNFYLKPADKDGLSLIYLQYWVKDKKLHYSFGERVRPKDWSSSKQRGKNVGLLTSDGEHSLNELLDNLKQVLEDAYKREKVNGIPSVGTIKAYLKEFMNQNSGKENGPAFWNLIDRFVKGEIMFRGRNKSRSSLNNYHSVKLHLEGFQAKYNYTLNFEAITLDFFYKYTAYLTNELKLARNTISKDISILKVFMGEAVDLGFTTNLQYKHKKFSVTEEDTDAVYLTEKEIIDLYRFDLSSKKKLEQVRDLFVFGCFVGLRFSDYSDIKPENIVTIEGEHFIKVITKKTRQEVIIPCNPLVLDIFHKYEKAPNKLPKALSNQKFNEYVKDALKEAKFEEIGRLSTAPTLPLHECVSSHTARRSFATNYYLQGFPTIDLMKITGHKTEKAFMKYIRVSKLDSAKRLAAHMKKNWSEKMLRVAS